MKRIAWMLVFLLCVLPLCTTISYAKNVYMSSVYTDVDDTNAFYEPVIWAYETGMLAENENSVFRPWDECVRADAVTWIWRFAKCPDAGSLGTPFSDMEEGSFYYNAVLWANKKGIAGGWSDGTFRPESTCTRAAAVTFLWRYYGCPSHNQSASPFSDVNQSNAFYDAIMWVYEKGIAGGWSDGTFRPWRNCSRAAMITFIFRAAGSPIYIDTAVTHQTYEGGYIEIQPDSWDGSQVTGEYTEETYGFPASISGDSREAIRTDILAGGGSGIKYIRFPLGFAYRGYRNIDSETGLAMNIGERFPGQNKSLQEWFSAISNDGGGLAPEYWCPPVYWVTNAAYGGDNNGPVNRLWAGDPYSRSTSLSSIRITDTAQYHAQIDAFTDAIVDDLEYLHTNIAPVRMFALQNEPNISESRPYGTCSYDAQTYNDVLTALIPKIRNSEILSIWNGVENTVRINVSSEFISPSSYSNGTYFKTGAVFLSAHADLIDLYSYRASRDVVSGEKTYTENGKVYRGADIYKSNYYYAVRQSMEARSMFTSEYEYFDNDYITGNQAFACGNNMLRMIYELTYGNATLLHPVIHIAKPAGQSFEGMSSLGYSMYSVGSDGNAVPNAWSYHSWKMFCELPVGSVLVGDYSQEREHTGCALLKKDNSYYLFLANNSAEPVEMTIQFDRAISFSGRAYNITETGSDIGLKNGDSMTFSVPAYSGQVWVGH